MPSRVDLSPFTILYITRKMVPITWRASPLFVFLYLHEEVGGLKK